MPRGETELLDSMLECGSCPSCGNREYIPEWELNDKSVWYGPRERGLGFWYTSWCPWCKHIIVHFEDGESAGFDIIRGAGFGIIKGTHDIIAFGAYLVASEIRCFSEQLESYGQSTTYCSTFYMMRRQREIDRKMKSLNALLKWYLG